VVLPLVRRRARPWRMELLGSRDLHEPMDVLTDDPEAVRPAVADLARTGACLDLRRVPQDSLLVAALTDAYRGRGVVVIRPAQPYPTMPLGPAWADPERNLSSRRRSDLRRAVRRAETMGEVSYELVDTVTDRLESSLADLVRVEGAGWKRRAGTALQCNPAAEQFYRTYAALAAGNGALRLSLLRIGGVVAAVQLAVHHDDRLWLLKIGYDEEFSRCSPGTLLLLRSVAAAAEQGARSVEFLGACEPWTARWTTLERPQVRIRAYGRSPSAPLCLADDVLDRAFATARQRRIERSRVASS
jgi:hypothetical protein